MFDVERLQQLRKGKFGAGLFYYDEIDSTNRLAAELARQDVEEGTVVVADCQNQGRGRNTNRWYSPPGLNLYFTVILYPPVERLHYLPFLTGWSIAETLELWGLHGDLKWPNDVLVDGRKISGVLIQTCVEENRLQFALVGIGINLNAKTYPEELQPIAVSIAQITGKDVDREAFLASILLALEQLYGRIGDMTWEELSTAVSNRSSFLVGCDVQMEQQGKLITGQTAGLDPMGGLILKTAGGREVFYAGEIQACRKK